MHMGDRDAELQACVDWLSSGDDEERAFAAEYLASLGGGAPTAVTGLIQALGDPDDRVRHAAATALGTMDLGSAAAAAEPRCLVPVLLGRAARDEVVRDCAEALLMRISPAELGLLEAAAALDEPTMRRLIYELHEMGEGGRELCCKLFARADTSRSVALDVLSRETRLAVRGSAVAVLGCHPPTSEDVEFLLGLCAGAWNCRVCKPEYIEAAKVLAKSGARALKPHVLERMTIIAISDEANLEICDYFTYAILSLGPRARGYVEKTIKSTYGQTNINATHNLQMKENYRKPVLRDYYGEPVLRDWWPG
jgi:hypothetical protein